MYTINIGTYTVGETTYENRCLSASFGGSGVQSETIVWEGTGHQPYDYKYENGEFILDVIEVVDHTAELNELKAKLAETDYVAIKIAEGVATKEEYSEILAQREEWRKRIREIELCLPR